jgi:hypothetical protein
MVYEVRDGHDLIASSAKRGTALLLAREWLRDPAQTMRGARTCVVQIRDDDGRLSGDHIVALAR